MYTGKTLVTEICIINKHERAIEKYVKQNYTCISNESKKKLLM